MFKRRVQVRRMVERHSLQWGIYIDGQLVEGGFESRAMAEEYARTYRAVEA